jgi:hypothetical protein
MWITVGSLVDSNNQKYSCSDKTQLYKIRYRRVGVEIIPSRVRVVSVKPGDLTFVSTCASTVLASIITAPVRRLLSATLIIMSRVFPRGDLGIDAKIVSRHEQLSEKINATVRAFILPECRSFLYFLPSLNFPNLFQFPRKKLSGARSNM